MHAAFVKKIRKFHIQFFCPQQNSSWLLVLLGMSNYIRLEGPTAHAGKPFNLNTRKDKQQPQQPHKQQSRMKGTQTHVESDRASCRIRQKKKPVARPVAVSAREKPKASSTESSSRSALAPAPSYPAFDTRKAPPFQFRPRQYVFVLKWGTLLASFATSPFHMHLNVPNLKSLHITLQ